MENFYTYLVHSASYNAISESFSSFTSKYSINPWCKKSSNVLIFTKNLSDTLTTFVLSDSK